MSELPKSWTLATLSEVCSLLTDGTHHSPVNSASGDFKYVTAKNLRPWGLDLKEITYVDAATHAAIYKRSPVRKGDVLYIKDGATTGLAVVNPLDEPFSLLSSVALLRPVSGSLRSDFLAYWLNSPSTFDEMIGQMSGSAIRRLTLNAIGSQKVVVPPLAEQRRIVAKLDALDASAKRARADLDRIPTLVARAKQAILTKAFQGDLTADFRVRYTTEAPRSRHAVSEEVEKQRRRAWNSWLEEQGSNRSYCAADAHEWTPDYVLPTGWHWFSVDELCAATQYGSSAKTDDNCAGVPVLRMGNIQNGALQFTNLKFLPSEHHEFPSLLLKEGDLLFNRTNSAELVGKSAVFEGLPYPCSFASYLIRLRPAAYSSKLLAAYINSEIGRTWIKTVVSQQVGQANVNGTKLGRLGVPYMPEAEQAEIVRRIEAAFAKIDRIAAEAASARALLDRLDQAILAKAFRGELVPQDPNDEPAEKLLEKIKAARAAPPTRKTQKKQS
jgi:type I restriction enzyme S subunit